jgi:Transposase
VWVTFEEGTRAGWLYDVLRPHVAHLVVCNPRKNALLKYGNKSDRIYARKFAELLRGSHLKPVYHDENRLRTLPELARSYLTTVKDLTRVMSSCASKYDENCWQRAGSILPPRSCDRYLPGADSIGGGSHSKTRKWFMDFARLRDRSCAY